MSPEARQEAEPPSPDRPEKGRPSPAIAILVNGASSSGKSTFCRALQERLTQLADGNPAAAFARVAFDDVVLLIAERLYPISVVKLQGGDLSRLAAALGGAQELGRPSRTRHPSDHRPLPPGCGLG